MRLLGGLLEVAEVVIALAGVRAHGERVPGLTQTAHRGAPGVAGREGLGPAALEDLADHVRARVERERVVAAGVGGGRGGERRLTAVQRAVAVAVDIRADLPARKTRLAPVLGAVDV